MNTDDARAIANTLDKYTLGPECNSDGTYTIGNCKPDQTCTAAAATLRAQADELDRWHRELSAVMRPDFKDWSSVTERPQLAAWVITIQREHYAALESERDALREELAELRKQEPVAWQCRFHISDSWAECSREHHDLVKSAQTEFQDYEARALYAAPKPGEQQ